MQLPDQVKPFLEIVKKHHFWMLAGVVPLVVVPILFLAQGKIAKAREESKTKIQSHLNAMGKVTGLSPHPNQEWSKQMNAQTMKIKRDTFAVWRKMYDDQKAVLHVWSESLGPDFVKNVQSLKSKPLSKPLREQYQNKVRQLVRELPKRMGSREQMLEARGQQQGMGGPPGMGMAGPPGGGLPIAKGPVQRNLVDWSAQDQARIYASFNWRTTPSTRQVLLAQEELWVYGLLCDVIAKTNTGSLGMYNSPVPIVIRLSIGYPAAEANLGGSGEGRIATVSAAAGGGMGGGGMGMGSMGMPSGGPSGPGGPGSGGGPTASAGRPAHPRFSSESGAGGGGSGMMPGGSSSGPPGPGAPAASGAADDSALLNWVYCDSSGKPLTAEELESSEDSKMFRMMPFQMEVRIDQRKIDSLLVELARAALPIDVRQVRINARAAVGGGGSESDAGMSQQPMSMQLSSGMGGAAGSGTSDNLSLRQHDVTLELRGLIGLMQSPDKTVLGIEETAEDAAEETVLEPTAEANPASDPSLEPTPNTEEMPAEKPPVSEDPVSAPENDTPVEPPAAKKPSPTDGAFYDRLRTRTIIQNMCSFYRKPESVIRFSVFDRPEKIT